jgi:trimeric autotransporter adhesin
MSTKTTFKRIALVAVAALGLGVLTSVAPANAAGVTPTALSAGTSSPSRVGAVSLTTITATHASEATNASFTAAVKVTSAPTGSKIASDTNTATLGASIVATSPVTTSGDTYVVGGEYATVNKNNSTAATSTAFAISFTADVAGTYTLLVSTGANAYAAGNASTVVTITTVGAPTSMTLASVAGKVVNSGTKGQLFSMTLKDANGNATVLGTNEGISLSEGSTSVYVGGIAASADNTAGATNTFSFGVNDANLSAGVYYFRALDGGTVATGTVVITANGNGLLPATLTSNVTATTVAIAANALPAGANTWDVTDATAYATGGSTGGSGAVTADYYSKGSSHSFTLTFVTEYLVSTVETASNWLVAVTTPTASLSYDTNVTVAAGELTGAVTISQAVAATNTAALSVAGAGLAAKSITFKASAATTMAIQGADLVLSATAAKNTFTVKVTDQYAAAMANVAVNVGVSGRNTVASAVLGVTDANGLISYSLTDAGTTGTRDTVSFTGVGAGVSATINYGTVTVGSVTVTGGSTAETIAGATKFNINASDNGPEKSYKEIKAVVKDASGNLLAGVPVVFTVDNGAIVKTASVDYATVYTGSDGSATTRAFGWTVSKQTVTATAGGVAKSGHINWVAEDATTARVLTATATGDIVSFKVVDRFGNAVKGVSIDLSRTGAGLFGSGKSTDTATTDKNGTADIRFIGSGTVVAELDAAVYAQAADKAGEIAETAVTAAVAGTTKGTGASLAPAGVAKVSVVIAEGADPVAVSSQAAADAAAEATDAANAATDAANAAAEAADAATAAAQDAADAVAALSTSVTAMVDSLRKQITSLTNLVIKIQRKVRA